MKYGKIKWGRFVARPNRFIAQVDIDGVVETVHVKNTGRCKELLLPGVEVVLEEATNPDRKTKYDLIAVEKAGLGLINIDSQAPNKIAAEWLAAKNFDYLYYTTPNEAALDVIEDEEALANEAIFPTDETLSRCESLRMLDQDVTDLYSKYWKQVKAD